MKTQRVFLLILNVLFLIACGQPGKKEATPPVAAQHEQQLIMHGDTRIDFYYWMNDRDNPEVIAYLEAENDYLKESLEHLEDNREELFEEMLGRLKQDESSAPFFQNGYYYYTRYEEGGEYPIYCRKKESMEAEEEVLLNIPQMAEGYRYFNVGNFSISPDNERIAYTVDTLGRRQYTIFYKDLDTQNVHSTAIEHAAGDVEWAADNNTFFFTTIDPVTLRYIKVFRYNTDTKTPEEVYYEEDDTYYYMGVSKTTDGKYLTIDVSTTLSTETLLLEADNPQGSFRVFQPRQRDLIYSVEHLDGTFYILTN
ncbi:MAG: oligopeptidase B, partial [Bacteroidota bacterium]